MRSCWWWAIVGSGDFPVCWWVRWPEACCTTRRVRSRWSRAEGLFPEGESVRRDAFVEWEQRFGHGETGVLGRLHAAAARRERISASDLHVIAEEVRRPVAAVTGAA